jgi:hypothetical protein
VCPEFRVSFESTLSRGGLVAARRLWDHASLGLRLIKIKKDPLKSKYLDEIFGDRLWWGCIKPKGPGGRGVERLIEHNVRHTVGAYGMPMRMSLAPPYDRCGTLCSNNPCISLTRECPPPKDVFEYSLYLAHKKFPPLLGPP